MSSTFSRPLRVATRGSALALWQTRNIASLLRVEIEEITLKTLGEQRADVPIHAMGGQGVFVKELQLAVLEGRADFAVHSAKDLPAETPNGLVIAAIPERADVRDALVGSSLASLREGAVIGTGSVRRRAQLAHVRPDLKFENLRGNIDTRLAKAKDFDAVVVAVAALQRLGHDNEIAETLSTDVMLPQVAQGALAIECRADDAELIELLASIEHADSRVCVDAERAFLSELGGACDYPEGAYAYVNKGGIVYLEGMLASLDGKTVLRHQVRGLDPVTSGQVVARHLLDKAGGQSILDELRAQRP